MLDECKCAADIVFHEGVIIAVTLLCLLPKHCQIIKDAAQGFVNVGTGSAANVTFHKELHKLRIFIGNSPLFVELFKEERID